MTFYRYLNNTYGLTEMPQKGHLVAVGNPDGMSRFRADRIREMLTTGKKC